MLFGGQYSQYQGIPGERKILAASLTLKLTPVEILSYSGTRDDSNETEERFSTIRKLDTRSDEVV